LHSSNHNSSLALRIVLLLALACLVAALISACGGGSPKRVLYEYTVAMMNKDLEKANSYCTPGYIGEVLQDTSGMAELTTQPAGLPTPSEVIPSYSEFADHVTVSIVGKTAKVSLNIEGVKIATWVMVQMPGGWKIDRVE